MKPTLRKILALAVSIVFAAGFLVNEIARAELSPYEKHVIEQAKLLGISPEAYRSVSSKVMTSSSSIPNLISILFYLGMLVLLAYALKGIRKSPWRVTVLRFCFAVVIGALPFLLNFMANTSFYGAVTDGHTDKITAVWVLFFVLFFWALLGYAIHRAILHYKNQAPPSEPPSKK